MTTRRQFILSAAALAAATRAWSQIKTATGCPFRLASSTTRSPTTSTTPVTWPAMTSACRGSNSAACGRRTSPNSATTRSPKQRRSSRSTSSASPTSPVRSSRPTCPALRFRNKARTMTSSAPTSITKSRTLCWSAASISPRASTPTASAALTSGSSTTRSRTAPRSIASSPKPPTICDKHKLILLLENEMACNTGTGEQALEVLTPSRTKTSCSIGIPANAATFPGNVPYPRRLRQAAKASHWPLPLQECRAFS